MRTIKRKTRHKKYFLRGWMLGFALTACFAVMGLSLAAWQENLPVGGTVHTGDIAPYFQQVHILDHLSARGEISLYFEDKGQRIFLTICDAHPGDLYGIEYRISNGGSVPVNLDLVYKSSMAGFTVKNTLPQGVLEKGEIACGEFTIKVDDSVEELSNYPYAFEVELVFKQWNRVS